MPAADTAVPTNSTTYLELSEEGGGAHKFYEVRTSARVGFYRTRGEIKRLR